MRATLPAPTFLLGQRRMPRKALCTQCPPLLRKPSSEEFRPFPSPPRTEHDPSIAGAGVAVTPTRHHVAVENITITPATLVAAIVAAVVLSGTFLQGLPRVAAMLVLWPVLCAGCFAVDGRMRRWFSWTPIRYLGNISYSYYLVHSLVLQGCFLLLERIWTPGGTAGWAYWAFLLPCFALTVVGALGLFLVVEKPFSLDRRSLHPRRLGQRLA